MRINVEHSHRKPRIHGYVVDELEVEEIAIGPIQLPDALTKSAQQACNFEGSAGHLQH